MVAYHGAQVVVTGGTGALGTAVVAALRAAGAVCHVTNIVQAELANYPHRNDPGVHVTSGIDLADEAAVRRFYGGLPPLWASIHLAGGFAMSPAADTSAVAFVDQFQMNALSSFLCSAAAIRAIRQRGMPGPGGAPSLALDDIVRGIAIVLRVAAARCDDLAVAEGTIS